MTVGSIPHNEFERLRTLKSYDVLDSLSEKEYDDLTQLASQICGTKIALISLIDENRQWVKSSVGIEVKETPRNFAFCSHAINIPNEPFIVEDSRLDIRFKDNPFVVGDPHIVFYAGIPLVNDENYALGTLCVIDNEPKKLSELQIQGLKTLSRSVMNLLELRKRNKELENEKEILTESLEFNNPFYVLLNQNGRIEYFGEKLLKVEPSLKKDTDFEDYFQFLSPFNWSEWRSSNIQEQTRLYFFQSKDEKKRFKFSIKRLGDFQIISAIPVVNSLYPLSNYHLTINDFSKHDYIAEFIFLQQTTDRSLADAKALLFKAQKKNNELKQAQVEVDILARFPSENPNPIVRLNYDLSLSYFNDAASKKFVKDFGISESGVLDKGLSDQLHNVLDNGRNIIKCIIEKNGRHYNIAIRNVTEHHYLNIYAADITKFIQQVQQKEDELKVLNEEVKSQKEFYEFVLNSLPSDIAVFSTDHKYLFVNPYGIRNPEIRNFMIGKDDFDYCEMKGISTEMAVNRRKIFNEVLKSGETKDWEDDLINDQGERHVIFRRIAPLKDDSGKVRYVVGYGVEITSTKVAEEKLIETNNQLLLLENFLNKTSDAIQVSDEDGKMIYINETASRRLGIPMNETQNYNVRNFEAYFESDQIWKEHIEFLKKHGVFNIESINVNQKTGEKVDVEVNVIYEQIKGKGYLIAASRDITERKKTQEELKRLSLVAKNTTNGVMILDKDRRIIWANDAIIIRSEYSADELIGQSPKMFQFEGTNQETVHRIYQKMLDRQVIQEEILHATKSGKQYWISLNIQPIYNSDNQLEGYIAIELDITERKKFEQTIASQNKDLKEITDALDHSALVSIADKSGIIIKANYKFCEVSGYSEAELLGQDHCIVNSGYHPKSFWVELWKTISSGKVWRGEVQNKKKNGEKYWVDSIIYPVFDVNGNIRHYLSIRHEITDRKNAEFELEKKADLQRLLVEISSKYINIPLNEVDNSINESLARIGNFVNVDRVYIFDYNFEKETTSNLYEWCQVGIEPQIDHLQDIPFSEVPVWVETHSKGDSIVVSNVKELAPSKFRELMESQDILSLIALPMMDRDKCIGFVGFDAVKELRSFSVEERNLLELYTQMLVNISRRTENLRQLEQAKKEIEDINTGLEQQVQEKTKVNLELAKSISDQEKMVTIGEVASGIAHDLNTPLGAIKSGAENIRFTLEQLFKNTIWKCTPDQISMACKRASEMHIELFVGGLQQRRETQIFSEYLSSTYPQLGENQISQIASGLVKNRVNLDDVEVISKVVHSENKEEFLELMYHIQMTRNFVDTIISSGERATEVVNDLRSFIKEQKSSVKGPVNLQQNIFTVLNIFNFEIKKSVDVQFNVDKDLVIQGIDIRLFQLWSNLIKNAIESMQENEGRGLLRILSTETDTFIQISIENNGPQIPIEIQERIFDKFFTTKGHKTGSGLGLSIVSSVLQEHNAKIDLISNELVTKFMIKFRK